MKKNRLIWSFAFAALLAGCSMDDMMEGGASVGPSAQEQAPETGTVPGVMNIRVSDELSDRLLGYADENGVLNADGIAQLSVPGIDITGVSTTFRIGGRFEKRQRAAGLHKWFTVRYDESVPVTKASEGASETAGIELAEPVMLKKQTAVEMNDPYYAQGLQWHYYNYGQNDFVPGIDIKLQQAWDTYGIFGSSDVIVAVADQGVQYNHPDLQGNMWVNEAELNGVSGQDDDGNGFTDDIYGYNFVYGNSVIHPQNHGTHVAGTIAAVNNNRTGMCGVAGGYYPEQGARIMALQLLEEGETYSGNTQMAFQYAADNGACIINNSWGYQSPEAPLTEADRTAIDYFIDNAGMDEEGNQTGPMKGGLVIFAAGNYASPTGYPAQYDRVLSVAAVGPTGKYAYYTNYGDWVDICAPGGDDAVNHDFGGVFSTLSNGMYGSDRGTSMACPHVSGVAALVLSTKTREDGFTADNLFKLLVNTADASIYDYNSGKLGQLGSGMLDALAALAAAEGCPDASPVTDFDLSSEGNTVTITLDVPENARYFYVYYSDSEFSDGTEDGVMMAEYGMTDLGYASDGRRTLTINGLEFNTDYWCAVSSANIIGEAAAMTGPETVRTKENRAPVITPDQTGDIVVSATGTVVRTYTIIEPDGQSFVKTFDTGGSSAVKFESLSDRSVQLTIDGSASKAGQYTCSITVTDETDTGSSLSTTLEIPYTVLENNAPKFLGMKEICLEKTGDTYLFNPYDIFYDADGDRLTFRYSVASNNVMSYTERADGLVEFVAVRPGNVTVAITAADPLKEEASGGINVIVRSSDKAFDIYPNPAMDFVKVRTQESGLYRVTVNSASGSTVYSGSASISLSNPLQIDLADVAPGQYSVIITNAEGASYTGTFVKI